MNKEYLLRHFIKLCLESGLGTSRNMSLTSKHSAKYRNNKNYPFHKNYPLKQENDLLEINPEEISIPKKLIHKELNPKIWNSDKTLRPDVRKKLLKIADEFYKYLEITIPIQGIRLIGSNANYNWSNQSDIDVHLFFDFKDLNSDKEFVQNFFDAKKNLWNLNHNIKIKGFPVELYCNSTEDNPHSAGMFDLYNNKWVTEPNYENFEIDTNCLQVKTAGIINRIEELENNKQLSVEEKHNNAIILRDRIKKMRQSGLEKGGEFSIENLSFKYLRNNNYIERLHNIIQKTFDLNLSLK